MTMARILPQDLRIRSEIPVAKSSTAPIEVKTTMSVAKPPIQGANGIKGRPRDEPKPPKNPGIEIPKRMRAAMIPVIARYAP